MAKKTQSNEEITETPVEKETPVESMEIDKKEPTPVEKETPKMTLSESVENLDESKARELEAYVRSAMDKDGFAPVANILSSLAASMFRIAGVSIEGLSEDVVKLEKVYPKVKGLWIDQSKNTKNKLVAIASAFENA